VHATDAHRHLDPRGDPPTAPTSGCRLHIKRDWESPPIQPNFRLASFSIAIRAARACPGVLTDLVNAKRTGRGPSLVVADISNPYRSMPVMLAEVIAVALENALQ
jgi:hypothetical protein